MNVVPWETAQPALLSTLKLSEADALAMAFPTVGAAARSQLTASRAGLSVNLSPGGLIPTARDITSGEDITIIERVGVPPDDPDTGEAPAEGKETTTKTTSGTKLMEGPVPGPGSTAVDLSSFTALDPGLLAAALEDDPYRRFAAAAALRAQVQLLDARIRQAAANEDVEPYLIQLEITAKPRRRELPYDLHTAVSFALYDAKGDILPGGMKVVPLFSNVDFERINLSDLAESIHQASLDVAGLIGSTGVQAGGGAGQREQARFVARNLNALTSVTRITDQDLDIRNGARWIGEDTYSLLAPSQTVAALLLVKKPEDADSVAHASAACQAEGEPRNPAHRCPRCPEADQHKAPALPVRLKAIARQQLVDGSDGRNLRLGRETTYVGGIERIVEDFKLQLRKDEAGTYHCKGAQEPLSDEQIKKFGLESLDDELGPNAAVNAGLLIRRRLADVWMNDDSDRLQEGLQCLAGDANLAHNIRLELAGLKHATQYAVDTAPLPQTAPPKLPAGDNFRHQLVYYSSTDKGIAVRLGLDGPTRIDGLQAALLLVDLEPDPSMQNLPPRLLAQSITRAGTALHLAFPPVSAKKYKPTKLRFRWLEPAAGGLAEQCLDLANLYPVPEAEAPKLERGREQQAAAHGERWPGR